MNEQDLNKQILYDGLLGKIWKRDPKSPSYQTFPIGYLAKGYNGMVTTDEQSAEKLLKRLAITVSYR
jgi:hypothetical protein